MSRFFSVKNPCLELSNLNCSHYCTIENKIAKCRCTNGFALANDNQTCLGKTSFCFTIYKSLIIPLVLKMSNTIDCLRDFINANYYDRLWSLCYVDNAKMFHKCLVRFLKWTPVFVFFRKHVSRNNSSVSSIYDRWLL